MDLGSNRRHGSMKSAALTGTQICRVQRFQNDVPAKAGLNMFSSEHHLVCMDHLKFFPSVNAMTGGEEDAEVWERMLRSAAYGGDLKGKQKVVLEEYH
ncbi:hypothetical protein BHM03_00003243 [Ensete ventricosum]|nr:hypothetical protein BHM03_00003243 [Ensete ventricosum]